MTDENKPLNVLLSELLHNNEGVFIGERHVDPALMQTLTYLMPQFNAEGVKTMSIEIGQSHIDDMMAAPTYEAWKAAGIRIEETMTPKDTYNLVKSAQKFGIKVIGHEDEALIEQLHQEYDKLNEDFLKNNKPELVEKIKKAEQEFIDHLLPSDTVPAVVDGKEVSMMTDDASKRFGQIKEDMLNKELEADPKFEEQYYALQFQSYKPLTADGLRTRNEAAASSINEEKVKDGKILVVGGVLHTNKEFDRQRPSDKQLASDGLDTLLDIPAVTADARGGSAVDPYIGDVGKTTQAANKHFETILPDDLESMLKNMGISSWAKNPQSLERDATLEHPLPSSSPGKAPSEKVELPGH